MSPPKDAVFRNSLQPDWGLGLVQAERADRMTLVFEKGGARTFIKGKAKMLIPATADEDTLQRLRSLAFGRAAAKRPGQKTGTKKASPSGPKAVFATFEEQLKVFERLFPGGFAGDAYVDEERGRPGTAKTAGYKEAAISLAKEELRPEHFQSGTPETLFNSAKRLLGMTNIAFPMEGPIPFGALPQAEWPAVVEALRQVLHGEGELGPRLERFAASLNFKDKEGQPKSVTWPTATLFCAFSSPTEHVCVKPTYFAQQAATLGLPAKASQPVSAAGYAEFLAVARETQRRLVEAGHAPRDLMDVYSFIWRTHKEGPAQPTAQG